MRPIIMASAPPQDTPAGGGGGDGTPATFDVAPGSYSADDTPSVSYTITASKPVVWNWSAAGSVPMSNVANGGSATSITFSLSAIKTDRESFIAVSVGASTWNLDLTAHGTGTA